MSICEHFSRPAPSLARTIASEHLQSTEDREATAMGYRPRGHRSGYEPTRQEIQAACAEIQASWTADDRARRQGMTLEQAFLERWTPPVVKVLVDRSQAHVIT